ncbi:uncharacterized protein [Spinacia oleracea]|uniref:Uncharacterized protein n=1 Tax=Spinacia oleracea TaxID=3562 RepID=A0ABM3QI34_SPIOL|nr:uncharacterized protein LOC110801548 [Spinacia oleracea]
MSYRRRGGLNGRGAIIRPPGYRSNGLTSTHIIGEETPQLPNYGHEADATMLNQVLNHHMPNSLTQAASTSQQAPRSSYQASLNMNMAATTNTTDTLQQVPNTIRQGPHSTPLHDTDVDHNREANTDVPDETSNPEKDHCVLHPDGLWFPHRAVVNKVSQTSYKSYFKGLYCNWKMTPPQVQQRWWNAFKHEFSWDPSVVKLVKKEWKSKASRLLTGIVSKLCNEPGYNAKWCPPTAREEMIQIRSEEENKKSRSMCKKSEWRWRP